MSEGDARWHIEYSDYGTVHSAEVECANCYGDYGDDLEFAAGGPAGVIGLGHL